MGCAGQRHPGAAASTGGCLSGRPHPTQPAHQTVKTGTAGGQTTETDFKSN